METCGETFRLDPLAVLRLDLGEAPGRVRRSLLRTLLLCSAGTVRVEGVARLRAAPRPAIFVLSHHNTWEAIATPSALVGCRRGRPLRFLVDWVYTELPLTSWLVRHADPIPVYRKRARFGWRERERRARRRLDPLAAAAAALAAGEDVAIYPEGRRQSDPWRLAPLEPGAARLALASGAAVVPVGVDLPARHRLGRLPYLGRVVLRVGDPIVPAEERAALAGGARTRRLAEQALTERIARSLAELSGKSATPSRRLRKEQVMFPVQSGNRLEVVQVSSPEDRLAALGVIDEVYREEKRWIADSAAEIAVDPGSDPRTIWLLARSGGEAVGVLRLVVDPELHLPAELGVQLESGVDVAELARSGRFAEVGRLMVRSAWRRRPAVVLALMRAALLAVVGRGCSHLVTVVFENDPHSPYDFHVRHLGFERIGTHERGELTCTSRRILLVLDIAKAYVRLGSRRRSIAGELARGLESRLREAGRSEESRWSGLGVGVEAQPVVAAS
ncbi:MAG: 1-acyl-sn-glycerol-3-phosphate acyltransferase [Thermoanaerobaculia bacterium]